jgi:hypothetical protein
VALLFVIVVLVSGLAYIKASERELELKKKAKDRELATAHELEREVAKGARQGLTEEAFLAGEGVSGG